MGVSRFEILDLLVKVLVLGRCLPFIPSKSSLPSGLGLAFGVPPLRFPRAARFSLDDHYLFSHGCTVELRYRGLGVGQMFRGFPCVIRLRVILPFDQIVNLSFDGLSSDDRFHFVLRFVVNRDSCDWSLRSAWEPSLVTGSVRLQELRVKCRMDIPFLRNLESERVVLDLFDNLEGSRELLLEFDRASFRYLQVPCIE